ncbi:hypothetical protein HHK36_009490 [Tetracentron sinense]|uniref:Aquaporin n=1 Tax=Tetracentron sinense TaxID=13715 RepID=A0A834ZGC0_TETSI|nr:hypothetical protein HHK36_009490 [Tetracentron sinense]
MVEEKTSPSQEFTVDVIVSPTNAHKILAEFMGTYIIIFVGCGSILADKRYRLTIMGIAVAWGLAVMVMIYSLGHISGAHFNPAITVAFAVSRACLCCISVAGFNSCNLYTLNVLFNVRVDIRATVTQYLGPTTSLEALTWEFMISFVNFDINELSGVAVGSAVLFNGLIAGSTTGASMNPARSIGPAIVSGEYHRLWVYNVAPTLGTMAATSI